MRCEIIQHSSTRFIGRSDIKKKVRVAKYKQQCCWGDYRRTKIKSLRGDEVGLFSEALQTKEYALDPKNEV